MSADSDYARVVRLLSAQRLTPYVAYMERDVVNGLGADSKQNRVVVRVSDGKVVEGSTHVKVQTGNYNANDVNPVTHPAFDPHCYRATGERDGSFEGKPALQITIAATCKSRNPNDNDYPFKTLYVDPSTMRPLDVNGTVPESENNKSVNVSLDQHYGEFDGRIMPSLFKLDVSGSGIMFWLQVHLTQTYGDYEFRNSYK